MQGKDSRKGEKMKVSYKQLSPNLSSKDDFKRQDITTNYKVIETNFDKLSDLLQDNGVMIANIELTNGYRSKSNVIYPATIEFLPLDIDETTLSIDYIHEILSDNGLNHILVATFDPNKAFKYRLFLQIKPITIYSEEEYKQLFSNIPDYISFDKACTNITRDFFIYAHSNYTIKEYFKGNPLEIKENKIDRTSSSPMCSRAERSEAHSSNGKLINHNPLNRSELSNTLKTRRCLWINKDNKTWYAYEVIHSHPVLLDEANIYKLLKQLSKQCKDKIRLSPTEKRKFSIRPDEKVCSSGFFFSNDCILFNDLGTDEFAYDIIDFCAKLIHGKIDKSSRDDICERLIKFFNLPKINPYCLE